MKITDRLSRCYKTSCAILMIGLCSAVAIYLTAEEASVDPFDEFEKSKKFVYELERMGGKSAVFANDINKWFAGLWHGETLAYTVAAITILIAAGHYFVATSLEAEVRMIDRKD